MNIEEYFKHLTGQQSKITVLTAYDYFTAKICQQAGIDAVLIGDSLGNVIQGGSSTQTVLMEHMVYHTQIVARNIGPDIPVISDLPAHSYDTVEEGIANAKALIDAGAHAVKFEGNDTILTKALVEQNIPVMGHIGLLPQTAAAFKVQGKDPKDAQRIIDEAVALETAGAFAIVIECVPEGLAEKISAILAIPVIGIGAGVHCDGQVLVIHDLLGMIPGKKARFIDEKAHLFDLGLEGVKQYILEVKNRQYPDDAHSYH